MEENGKMLNSKLGCKNLYGEIVEERKIGKIADRFLCAPFTVLDTRTGWWRRRKKAWLKLGIQSELGRDVIPGKGGPNSCMHRTTGKYGDKKERCPRKIEEWKPVVGWEGKYEVSCCGRIKSVALNLILRPKISKKGKGYYRVEFSRNDKKQKRFVHVLVAQAFCSGYKEGLQVNHKDFNKLHNWADNLEWVTGEENRKHEFDRVSFQWENNPSHKLTYEQVKTIRSLKGSESAINLGKKYGVDRITIYSIWKGNSWKKFKQKLAPGGGGGGCWLGGKKTQTSEQYGHKGKAGSGTSIFDPVLTELCCRWFCPVGGQIIDPFAGGSVRGIVSTICGYNYWGCELRKEQVLANIEQRKLICPDTNLKWVCGDSNKKIYESPGADMILSCPPYGNLEVYSNDPSDISNMSKDDFSKIYTEIIRKSCSRLRQDRFACFVVGDYRTKEGAYQGFIAETIKAFRKAGLRLWNEFIIVKAIGSLPIRMTKPFNLNRKAGKMHENLLVFVKGSGMEAAKACGQVNTGW